MPMTIDATTFTGITDPDQLRGLAAQFAALAGYLQARALVAHVETYGGAGGRAIKGRAEVEAAHAVSDALQAVTPIELPQED
jgi:hypothetical protein